LTTTVCDATVLAADILRPQTGLIVEPDLSDEHREQAKTTANRIMTMVRHARRQAPFDATESSSVYSCEH
jgi:hypothetical protein